MDAKMSEAEQRFRSVLKERHEQAQADGVARTVSSTTDTMTALLSELDRLRESEPKDVRSEVLAENASSMFETLKYWACQRNAGWEWDDVIDSIQEDVAKIETQIAAAEKSRATGGEGP